jgi:hypothetical protein
MRSTGSEVVKATLTPVIPAELHGFTVTVGIGPYPPGQPQPGREAVYAELLPMSEKARRALKYIGRERILGMVPLTVEAAGECKANPQGQLAEIVARRAVAEASRLARTIDQI